MERMRVGVIGTGVLGRYHTRVYSQLAEAELVGVYDVDPTAAQRVATEFGTRAFSTTTELAALVDAVSLAVPASLHHGIAMDLLERQRHLLVEKPVAATSAQAREMIAAAAANSLVLAVGHVERFNPVLSVLADLNGSPTYIEAKRLMPCPPMRSGQVRRGGDVSVILDLMIHDLDLMLSLVPEAVVEVSCTAARVLGDLEDFAVAQLTFAGGAVAHLTASRIHPESQRTWLVHAGTQQYHLDFVHNRALVTELGADGIGCTTPAVPTRNALEDELRDFCRCVQGARRAGPSVRPRVSGEEGLRALELAERVMAACRR